MWPAAEPIAARATIRHATRADTAALVAMAERFLQTSLYGALLPTTSAHLDTVVAIVLQAGTVLIAELDGQPVGMLAVVAAEHPVGGQPYAEELAWWVEPAYRRGQVGAALLDEAEAWAAHRGLRLLKMVAPEGAQELAAFYQARGYTPLERSYVKPLLHVDGVR